jgi:putative RNA 2'-phosphotransferase
MTSREQSFVVENEKIRAVYRDDALRFQEDILVPGLLYHCVRRKAYSVVCRQGILPLGQSGVFLATTQELAQRMGKRRDPAPVLLNVHARRASDAGVRFLRYGEFIYVTGHVPVDYFTGPPPPQEKKKEATVSKREPFVMPKGLPGSFTLDVERSQSLQRQVLKRKGLKKEVAWKRDVRSLRRKAKR